MSSYASALRDPDATYRQIDLVGRTAEADGPALVQLLYEEAIHALRAAAWAAENQQTKTKSDKVTRATAIMFALEANLDHDAGGDVAQTLAKLYAGARRMIIDASIGSDPAPFREVASMLEEIGQAWRSARAA
jgi:flagellar protein FliS